MNGKRVALTLGMVIFLGWMGLNAQYWSGRDSLFGNEWIDFDQEYFKIKVIEDGIFRVSRAALEQSGVPVQNVEARFFQLWKLGAEVPMFSTTDDLMQSSDYLLFYGEKNKGEFDTPLYPNHEEDQLNPEYSMFSDTAVYFLTWSDQKQGARILSTPNLPNAAPPEEYYMEEIKMAYSNKYVKYCGDAGCLNIFSIFDKGEGYAHNARPSDFTTVIDPIHAVKTGPKPRLRVRATTNMERKAVASDAGEFLVYLNDEKVYAYNRTPAEYPFLHQMDQEVDWKFLDTPVEVVVTGSNDPNDRYNVSVLSFSYPKLFDFDQSEYYELKIEQSTEDKNLQIRNFDAGGTLQVYNRTKNQLSILPEDSTDHFSCYLKESTEDQELVFFQEKSIHEVNALSPTGWVDLRQGSAQFIIITHPHFLDNGQGENYIQEYADYRSSASGGSYETMIVTVDQLYDQFAYGIASHPNAIRLFTQYIHDYWDRPEYLFIIGKGVHHYLIRKTHSDFHYVPTFGQPGSDGLLVSDPLFNSLYPVGRIPIVSSEEVHTYLEKVKIYEQNNGAQHNSEEKLWRKRVMHLSGGNIGEQEIFTLRGGLDRMASIIESNKMGAHVTTFQKKTSGTIAVSENKQITRMVEDGLGLITYFGHSSVALLDFQIIDDVNLFEPNTRFPVYMGMGCYAGNLYDNSQRSYSEQWTLADQRGAIAFVANSSAGFISSLEQVGSKIYENYGGDFYTQSVGKSIHAARTWMINSKRKGADGLQFDPDTELAFSLNMCGDPAISLLTQEGSDFVVDPSSVGLEEKIVTIEDDSLHLFFTLQNLGEAREDSIDVSIEQTLPSGARIHLSTLRVLSPKYEDRHQVVILNQKEDAVGFNKINIMVDANREVSEKPAPQAEANNDLRSMDKEYLFFVASEEARPVYPNDFGIVGTPSVTLVASTSNSNAEALNYIIQIDTSERFNTSFLRQTTLRREGGIVKWTPDLVLEGEKVYYWRISPDSIGRGEYTWRGHSFTHVENHGGGWNQGHSYQFLHDQEKNLKVNTSGKTWNFDSLFVDLKIKNVVQNVIPNKRPAMNRNNVNYWDYNAYAWGSVANGVYVTVLDPVNVEYVSNPSPGLYGSQNRLGKEMKVFAFDTKDYEGRIALSNFLENEVARDHYVVFMTVQNIGGDYGASQWEVGRDSSKNQSLFDVLEEKGAHSVRQLEQGDVPYIFVYQQGNPSFPVQETFGNLTSETEVNVNIATFADEGSLTSTVIGPADVWTDFVWQRSEWDRASEEMGVTILGLDLQGREDTLFSRSSMDKVDLSQIASQQYPYLRLYLEVADSVDRSMPQLDYWRITYDGYPELAIDANDDFVFNQDTIEQGKDMFLQYAFENVGDYGTDTVGVCYRIVNDQNEVITSTQRTQPTKPGERVILDFQRNTADLSGTYRLIVEVNPNQEIRELYDWNNSFIIPFTVIGDQRNPILDVTFDGLHILDGDLVSARPEIVIRLKDENKHLLLNDTSLFSLSLQGPDENAFSDVVLNDPDIQFRPATKNNNEAYLRLYKRFGKDGIYTLKVSGRDRSGNASGDIDYQVRFEIVTETSLSELINYPNPFTTSTQFVYTLTGEVAPAFFKIQILTVSGKVVREISSAELGPLRIGKHMTDYRYDGTDAFGHPLANGVYLYRVVARDQNGDELKARDVGIGQYFKKGWGKMVILR